MASVVLVEGYFARLVFDQLVLYLDTLDFPIGPTEGVIG